MSFPEGWIHPDGFSTRGPELGSTGVQIARLLPLATPKRPHDNECRRSDRHCPDCGLVLPGSRHAEWSVVPRSARPRRRWGPTFHSWRRQ